MDYKRKILVLAVTVLLLTFVVLPSGAGKTASSRTIVVPDDFSSIQEAIYNATAGDTVFVKAGNYTLTNPPLYINQSISLIGENCHNTIITTTETHVRVYAYGFEVVMAASNVTVSGFTITGKRNVVFVGGESCLSNNIINLPADGDTAIRVDSGIISSNTINGGSRGIINQDLGSGNIGIDNNPLTNAVYSNNIINGFGKGISGGSPGLRILNNTICNNTIGIFISDNPVLMQDNNILNSTAYAVYGMANINATYNWWGTDDSQKITNLITTGTHTNSTVIFIPFLIAPNPQAIPTQNMNTSINSMFTVPEYLLGIITLALIAISVAIILYAQKRRPL
jgi:hypothetical protein